MHYAHTRCFRQFSEVYKPTRFEIPNTYSSVRWTSKERTVWQRWMVVSSHFWVNLKKTQKTLIITPASSSEPLPCFCIWGSQVSWETKEIFAAYLNAPNTWIVIQKRGNFSNFFEVFYVPCVNAVIVVNTG